MSELGRSDSGPTFRYNGTGNGLAALANAARPVLKPSSGPDMSALVAGLHEAMISSIDTGGIL